MNFSKDTNLVLSNLLTLWTARLDELPNYLNANFSYSIGSFPTIKRLFIAEMSNGDVLKDNIGSEYAHKWLIVASSLVSVSLDYAYDEMYETNASGEVYLSPSYLFCHQGNVVLLSERYGPSLKHRLRGTIIPNGEQCTIEWISLWRSTD